jgi:hypothetical protein
MIVLLLVLVFGTVSSSICNTPLDSSLILSIASSSNNTINCAHVADSNKTIFCYDNATINTNWFSISTSVPFIAHHVEFRSPYAANTTVKIPVIPSTVRLQSTVTSSDEPAWYRTRQDRDTGIPWTSLSVSRDGVVDIPDGFEFTNIQIWPSSLTAGPMDFEPIIFGCLSNQTSVVRLEFNSSKNAIETSFSAMQFFEQAVTQIISEHANIPESRYVVHAAALNNTDTSGVVKVYIRLLPDSAPGADSVEKLKNTIFGNTRLVGALGALQGYVEDTDASLCHRKFCELGWLCVSGRCYDQEGDSMLPYLVPPPTQLRIGVSQQFRLYSETSETSSGISNMNYIIPIVIGSVLFLSLLGVVVNHVLNSKRKNEPTGEETAQLITGRNPS